MTEDAWFGVTPEPIANKIAAHIAESALKEKTVIVDAFAGVGGNAIALARSGRWERVFAIEKDPKTLKCAKHNAEIYGVANKIFWLAGDCFETIRTSYGEDDVFDLTKMEPYNLEKLYRSFTKYSKEVVLYLPRNSDLNQIARYVPEGQKLEVAHYAIMAASKALCVYFGDFNFDVAEDEEK
ncbi:putative diacylglycerol O-acyltransferase tgs1 [Ascochyta rabiei]|nr:putative diacylglycerol O-acyltransferase tgs1 [Ascochyta rabiei]UPX19493.1 putative diacylglycerol O-acyltransferase tgs1 [Ascochyta rabiei]